jgi:hypothetical protein
MTDRYRHLLDGHEQEAVDRLDAYLAKATAVEYATLSTSTSS